MKFEIGGKNVQATLLGFQDLIWRNDLIQQVGYLFPFVEEKYLLFTFQLVHVIFWKVYIRDNPILIVALACTWKQNIVNKH